jgi:hypothetical protein
LDIVCTNKGQHRPLKLAEFRDGKMVGIATGHGPDEGMNVWQPFGHWASMLSETPVTETQTFKCRRCDRSPELSASKLVAALDGLQSMGGSQLDVSLLPF